MSNNIVKNGVAIKRPLIGTGGEIKKVHIVEPIPVSAASMAKQIQDIALGKIKSDGNRDTEVKNLRKIISKAGGVNGNLWQAPRVAKVEGEDKYILWDGDHSKAIYQAIHPSAKTMPCRVVNVSSKTEVHDLFVQANAKCRTAVTAEVIFVNEVLNQDPDALYNKALLQAAGLYVYCSSEPNGKQGDTSGQRIKIGGALRCFEASGRGTASVKKYLKPAVSTVSKMRDFPRLKRMPAELLEALTMVYVNYPDYLPIGTQGKAFEDWYLDVSKRKSVTDFASDLKKQGGSIVNAAALSVAKGLILEIKKDPAFTNVTLKI